MSYNRPSLSELIERARLDIEGRLVGADARLRQGVLDVLARMHAGGLSALYGYADWISRQILPDTAEAEILARTASIWGVARKAATAAQGEVTFTGTDGITVPAGTLLTRVDGAQYRTSADVLIAAGTALAAVEALVTGPGGAMDTGQHLTFVQLVAGVSADAIVAAPGIVPGIDEESDESLLSRLLERIRRPPQGGSKYDYERWALAIPGVTRAWVYPAWLGAGTVGVTFVMDGQVDIIPAGGDVALVQAALDDLRPVTADLTVFAPVAVPVNFTIQSAPASAAVHSAIVAELTDLFRRDAEPGGTMRLSRMSEAVSIAAGEEYHNLVAPGADVIAAAGELPILGTVTFP